MAECSSCGAPIIWALTLNGKRMPVDVAPDPAGRFYLATMRGPGPSAYIVAVHAGEEWLEGPSRYSSHFSTCLYADQHRKG